MERKHYICAVNEFSDMVYRIALNYCKNKEDAEDVMQNTFLKLYQYEKEFQDREHEKRWLIRVAINECHSLLRSPWNRKRRDLGGLEGFVTEMEPSLGYVFELVMELPMKYRVVVYLYYYEGYKAREIAQILQIKETTVQTRLMRARQLLRGKLERERKVT